MRKAKRVLHFLPGAFAIISIALTVSSCSSRRPAIPAHIAEAAITQITEKAVRPAINEGCQPEECLKSALKDLSRGDLFPAERRLEEARARFPETVWAARASFLLASIALQRGEDALGLLEEASTLSRIPDYILFYKARAFYQEMRFEEAVEACNSLIALYPDSVLRPDAFYLKGLTRMEAGDFFGARKAFGEFISFFPENSSIPNALLMMAESSVKLNEPAEAIGPVKRLLVYYPADEAADEAQSLLDGFREGGSEAQGLTEEEEFERAKRLFFKARYKDAAEGFSEVLKNRQSPFLDSAAIKKAIAQTRLKKYSEAQETLKDYLSLNAPKMECEALYWLGVASLRMSKEGELLQTEKRLSSRCPSGPERGQVLLFLGRLYSEKGLKEEAQEIYRRVTEDFKGSLPAEEAAWALGWSNYRAGRFEEAYRDFFSSIAARPEGRSLGQFLYWAGKSLEKIGRTSEARGVYERLCALDSDGYYCMMARDRLSTLLKGPLSAAYKPYTVNPEFSFVESPFLMSDNDYGFYGEEGAKAGLIEDGHYRASLELLSLGLKEEAAREIDLLTKRYSDEKEALTGLALLLYEAGDYYRALKLHQSYLSGVKREETAALAFPPRLVEEIREKADSSIDPCLVAAVMREESHFNPKAVSKAGALGVMQIMPSTGALAARGLNKKFEEKDLLDPDFSIELGSWYLGHLARRFGGDLVLTIAGYNAGPGAAARWKATLPKEPDEFIESIPYPETRAYAKKVLRSYGKFLKFSGEGEIGLGAITRVKKTGNDVKIYQKKGRS